MFDWHDHQAIQKLVYNSDLYTLVHLSFRPDDRVSHVWICTLSANRINTGFGFPVVHKSHKSHPSQIRLAHNNNQLPGRMESCWKEAPEGFSRTARSHLTMSPVCLGTLQWRLPSNGANWLIVVTSLRRACWTWLSKQLPRRLQLERELLLKRF